MRCFRGTSYDDFDSFSLVDVPDPVPADNQVLIRVEAAALGFVDGLMVQGRYQLRPPLPYIPGGELAGVVLETGAGVKGLRAGDRVVAKRLGGGLAEQICVDAVDADLLDDRISTSAAAAMLTDYQTSHYALFDQGRLTAGDRVLVLGAAGGVGAVAVQMASRAGAMVIAAASTEDKRARARDLGAHACIDSSRADWREQLKLVAPGAAVDIVFDPVGDTFFEPAFRSLAKEGRYLVIGFAAGRIPSLPVNLALLKNASLIGVDIRHFQATRPEQASAVRRSIYRMVADGYLKPPTLVTFPLQQAREALLATMDRQRHGKVVVLI